MLMDASGHPRPTPMWFSESIASDSASDHVAGGSAAENGTKEMSDHHDDDFDGDDGDDDHDVDDDDGDGDIHEDADAGCDDHCETTADGVTESREEWDNAASFYSRGVRGVCRQEVRAFKSNRVLTEIVI